MGIFDFIGSQEQENLKKQKEKKTLEKADMLAYEKVQKRLREKLKTKESLDKLKDLVGSGILSKKNIEHIISGEILETGEIKEILDKIDEITHLDSQGKILPRDLKISKEEYLEAIGDFDKKVLLLEKIDQALDYIYAQMGGGGLTFSLFSFLSYQLILSKETQIVQGNLIDIKNGVLQAKTL